MRKRYWAGAGIILILVAGWMLYKHHHYSAPEMSEKEIVRLAEIELKNEVPSLLEEQRDLEKKLTSIDILDVNKLGEKTYVVFKLDYHVVYEEGYDDYNFNSGNFMLGYRLVEKKWGGISLRDGMEFETSYMGVAPVECGHHPVEGIFYGFCKDPLVSKAVLEYEDQPSIEIPAENRIIFAQVPRDLPEIKPHFYTAEGEELYQVYGLRVAMVSDDEQTFEKFTHTPLNWWPMRAEDLYSLNMETADAVWIFPDQHEKVWEDQLTDEIKRLSQQGIPVLFVGMQDIEKVTGIFNIGEIDNKNIPIEDIEAVYLASDINGEMKTGIVALADSAMSPLAETTLSLRYRLEIPHSPVAEPGTDESVVNRDDGSVVIKGGQQ